MMFSIAGRRSSYHPPNQMSIRFERRKNRTNGIGELTEGLSNLRIGDGDGPFINVRSNERIHLLVQIGADTQFVVENDSLEFFDSSFESFDPTSGTHKSISGSNVEHELCAASSGSHFFDENSERLTYRSIIRTTLDGGTSVAKSVPCRGVIPPFPAKKTAHEESQSRFSSRKVGAKTYCSIPCPSQ